MDFVDRPACQQVADGEYWLDPATGLWDYKGDQIIRGRMSGRCETPVVADNSPTARPEHRIPD